MSSVDETSIKFTWNASKACDGIQYSLNGGNWVGGDWPQTNITGLSANTQYSVKIRVKATDSQLWTESGVKYATTYAYPYCTSAPSFKIGNNVKLDFYNPLNRTIKIQMWSHNSQDFVSDQITISGTTYTGFSNVKDRLYASIPDKTESQYTIDVWYGDIKSTKWDCGKYSINGNEKPTFSNFTYADINSKTVGLTGNNQILVSGYSNLKVTVSTANKAYSNYGSPIKKYRLNVGNMSSVEKDYSSSAAVEMSINAVNSPSITVTAIDSREYTTPISKTSSFKAYKKPIIKSMNVYRSDGGVGSQVTLEFDGEWWNDNFGSVANSISNISYYYKKTSDTNWTKGNISIIPTISGNSFSGSALIEGPNIADKGFDITTAYNIKIIITDQLDSSTEYQTVLSTGAPAIAICNNKVSVGLKYDENLGGALQVKGEVVEQGLRVGATQPNTKETVWLKQSKNLISEKDLIHGLNFPEDNYVEENYENGLTTKWIKVKPNTTYTISGGNRNRTYIKSKTGVITYMGQTWEHSWFTFTTLPDTEYVRIYVYDYYNTSIVYPTLPNVQLEEGDAQTSYEPYLSNSIKIKQPDGTYNTFMSADIICIGSQVIHNGVSGTGLMSKTFLCEHYDYGLFEGVGIQIKAPAGYHKEYSLSFFGWTGENNSVNIYINDVKLCSLLTWGPDYFKTCKSSRLFRPEEIPLVATKVNSSRLGTKLFYDVTGVDGFPFEALNITINAYLVRD